MYNVKSIFKNKIAYTESLKDILVNSDCAVIMTPWQQYKKIQEKDFLTMRHPIIVDTRRMLNINNEKIHYIGLGIGQY